MKKSKNGTSNDDDNGNDKHNNHDKKNKLFYGIDHSNDNT